MLLFGCCLMALFFSLFLRHPWIWQVLTWRMSPNFTRLEKLFIKTLNITRGIYEKYTAWRLKSTSSFTRKSDFARIAKRWVRYQCGPRDIGVSHAISVCANDGMPFKVSCQDLANRRQNIFRMKTTFISASCRKQSPIF